MYKVKRTQLKSDTIKDMLKYENYKTLKIQNETNETRFLPKRKFNSNLISILYYLSIVRQLIMDNIVEHSPKHILEQTH